MLKAPYIKGANTGWTSGSTHLTCKKNDMADSVTQPTQPVGLKTNFLFLKIFFNFFPEFFIFTNQIWDSF